MKLTCQHCDVTLNIPDEKVPIGRPFNFSCPRCHKKNSTLIENLNDENNADSNSERPEKDSEVRPAEKEQTGDVLNFKRKQPLKVPEPEKKPPPPPLPPGLTNGISSKMPPIPPWQAQAHEMTSMSIINPGATQMQMETALFNFDSTVTDNTNYTSTNTTPLPRTALIAINEGKILNKILEKLENLEYLVTISYGMRDALRQIKLSDFDLIIVADDFDGAEGNENNHVLKNLQMMEMENRRRIYVILIGKNFRTLDGFTAYGLSVNAVMNISEIEQFEKIIISGLSLYNRFYKMFVTLLDRKMQV